MFSTETSKAKMISKELKARASAYLQNPANKAELNVIVTALQVGKSIWFDS